MTFKKLEKSILIFEKGTIWFLASVFFCLYEFANCWVVIGEAWEFAREHVNDFHRQIQVRATHVHTNAQICSGYHFRIVINFKPFCFNLYVRSIFSAELLKFLDEHLFLGSCSSDNNMKFCHLWVFHRFNGIFLKRFDEKAEIFIWRVTSRGNQKDGSTLFQ